MKYAYFQCQRPTCRFRFPASSSKKEYSCPKCGAPLSFVSFPQIESTREKSIQITGSIAVLLDNIRSAYNVGSIFRTADGAGVSEIILSGITPTPDHPGAIKTALGAEMSIPWSQTWSSLECCESYRKNGFTLVVLEKNITAIPIMEMLFEFQPEKVLLVVGNENSGVDPDILNLADKIVFLPMLGLKESLNVSVAFGICIYWLRFAHNNIK